MQVLEKIICNKKELRKSALVKREFFSNSGLLDKCSKRIVSKILNSTYFKTANNIALYFPIKNEIDITPILCNADKNFYFPCCNNNELIFRLFEGFHNLKKGKYDILEPVGKILNPADLDLIFVPALLANNAGYRLGYGKGYYDRFFSKHPFNYKKVIVISSLFISDKFVQDDNDVKCDFILSEL